MCYYTSWSPYRKASAQFTPADINPHLCTHINYVYAEVSITNELKPFDEYQDIELEGYTRVNNLKAFNKDLKVILSVGGISSVSGRLSVLVSNVETRQKFIQNTINFLRKNKFDGVDFLWMDPAGM